MSEALRLRPRGAVPGDGPVQSAAPSLMPETTNAIPSAARAAYAQASYQASQASAAQAAKPLKVAKAAGATKAGINGGSLALWLTASALLGGGAMLGGMMGPPPKPYIAAVPVIVSPRIEAQASAAPALPAHTDAHSMPQPIGLQAVRVALAEPPTPLPVYTAATVMPEPEPAPPPPQAAAEAPAPVAAPIPAPAPKVEARKPESKPAEIKAPEPKMAETKPAPAPKSAVIAAPPPQAATEAGGPARVIRPVFAETHQAVQRMAFAAPQAVPAPDSERWRALAAQPPAGAKPPYIAIVLDDMGTDRRAVQRVLKMPAPVTMSFLAYAEDVAEQAAAVRATGREVMLHLPMEPIDLRHNNPGPNALLVAQSDEEMARRLTWSLERFSDYVGVNNHMGSRFTADSRGMGLVLAELQRRGVFWLDSLTGPRSVGLSESRRMGLAATARDLFLDDEAASSGENGVTDRMAQVEAIARRSGAAIAIGHPHAATLAALERWIGELRGKGFSIVPVSTVLRYRLDGPGPNAARQTAAAPIGQREPG